MPLVVGGGGGVHRRTEVRLDLHWKEIIAIASQTNTGTISEPPVLEELGDKTLLPPWGNLFGSKKAQYKTSIGWHGMHMGFPIHLDFKLDTVLKLNWIYWSELMTPG